MISATGGIRTKIITTKDYLRITNVLLIVIAVVGCSHRLKTNLCFLFQISFTKANIGNIATVKSFKIFF